MFYWLQYYMFLGYNKSFTYMNTLRALLVCLLCALTFAADPYSTQLAYTLTHYSSIAYEQATAIESWSCPQCQQFPLLMPKVVTNTSNSVYGYIGYNPQLNAIIIAFRGSVDTANWILNLKTTRTGYDLCSGCSVHVGFNQGFNSVKSQVISHVEHLMSLYRNSKIMMTGHSLGGALSVMGAAFLQNTYKNVECLYTLGQPRVGNDKFAAFMTEFIPNTFRIVNYGDQVPHIPQSILGFKHSGYEVWYNVKVMVDYKICPSESKQCSNQFTILTLNQADHKLLLYKQISAEEQSSMSWLMHRARFQWLQWTKNWRSQEDANLSIENVQEETQ